MLETALSKKLKRMLFPFKNISQIHNIVETFIPREIPIITKKNGWTSALYTTMDKKSFISGILFFYNELSKKMFVVINFGTLDNLNFKIVSNFEPLSEEERDILNIYQKQNTVKDIKNYIFGKSRSKTLYRFEGTPLFFYFLKNIKKTPYFKTKTSTIGFSFLSALKNLLIAKANKERIENLDPNKIKKIENRIVYEVFFDLFSGRGTYLHRNRALHLESAYIGMNLYDFLMTQASYSFEEYYIFIKRIEWNLKFEEIKNKLIQNRENINELQGLLKKKLSSNIRVYENLIEDIHSNIEERTELLLSEDNWDKFREKMKNNKITKKEKDSTIYSI